MRVTVRNRRATREQPGGYQIGGMRILMLVGLAGCVTYKPGAFAHGMTVFTGTKTTIGCLDIAVDRREDHDQSAVLSYKFGNRCEHPQVVDLGGLNVVGRDAAGAEYALRPFDPKAQIRPMPVDAGLIGGEAIAYVADANVGVELVQICVDAGSIVEGQATQWMCFAKKIEVPEEPEEEITLVHEETV